MIMLRLHYILCMLYMYVSLCTYVRMYMYIHKYMHVRTYLHDCTYIQKYVCTIRKFCIATYVHTYVRISCIASLKSRQDQIQKDARELSLKIKDPHHGNHAHIYCRIHCVCMYQCCGNGN